MLVSSSKRVVHLGAGCLETVLCHATQGTHLLYYESVTVVRAYEGYHAEVAFLIVLD